MNTLNKKTICVPVKIMSDVITLIRTVKFKLFVFFCNFAFSIFRLWLSLETVVENLGSFRGKQIEWQSGKHA